MTNSPSPSLQEVLTGGGRGGCVLLVPRLRAFAPPRPRSVPLRASPCPSMPLRASAPPRPSAPPKSSVPPRPSTPLQTSACLRAFASARARARAAPPPPPRLRATRRLRASRGLCSACGLGGPHKTPLFKRCCFPTRPNLLAFVFLARGPNLLGSARQQPEGSLVLSAGFVTGTWVS